MIKKVLKISLVFLLLLSMQQAKADEVTIGSTIYPLVGSIGIKAENYYVVTFTSAESSGTQIASFVMYIPNELFANGTYDLNVLNSGSNSVDEAVEACENPDSEEDSEITLPSTDKIYILGGVTKIQESDSFIAGKGITIANKDFSGTKVTLSGIGSSEGSPTVEEVDFSIDGNIPFTTVKYRVFISDNCQEVLKKSKFVVSKKAKNTSFALDATTNILDPNFDF